MSRRDDLAYGDYYGNSWDRDRFERMRARSRGPPREVDLRYEEDDYYRRGGDRRDVRVEVDERRRSGGRDLDPYDDRYRRPEYLEQDRYDVRNRDLAPYRPGPRYEEVIIRRPARPGLLRRQTSLDTFDRPPQPRYDQEERDINVNVNLGANDPARYETREEEYRDVRIRRERERDIYRRRASSSSGEEAPIPAPRPKYKKGKTRMPKRLAHLRAIADLGLPYQEEDYFWVIQFALGKNDIDDVIEQSKVYFREERLTIRVDESKLLEPAKAESSAGGRDEPGIIETKTTKIITNPTEEDFARLEGRSEPSPEISQSVAASIRSPSPSRGGRRGRSSSRKRGSEIFEEKEKEQQLTLVLPSREKSRSRRDIDEEIRRLEAEKRAIRRERRRERDYDTETVHPRDEYETERDNDREVRLHRDAFGNLQLERNIQSRRSKSSRRRPTQRDVNAALFALT